MSNDSGKMKLGEAAEGFLKSVSAGEGEMSRQVIYRFVRWFGGERPLDRITAQEIANYAGRLSSSDTDHAKKLEPVRGFLAYAGKTGWTRNNMAVHLKAKKGRSKTLSRSSRAPRETISLTQHGYDEVKKELEVLASKRLHTISEIRKAAEDKDFKENAPLAAAREELGHIEGKIINLKETLKLAVLISDHPELTARAGIGNGVVLLDLASGEDLRYTIVSPREADPIKGKISSVSPIGKAIMGRSLGDTIEIKVPAGRLRYKIKQVGGRHT